MKPHDTNIRHVRSSAYSIPTTSPESDGTLAWNKTVLVIAEIEAGDLAGFGYTYCSKAAAQVIVDELQPALLVKDILAGEILWQSMRAAVRNIGYPGIAACAISAVDIALWDLRAKWLNVPLAKMLGLARAQVEAYGSGGFTSYDLVHLCEQLSGWAEEGCRQVKMKIGRHPGDDLERVQAIREVIGRAELFVDANGAYSAKQALALADGLAAQGVTWFEEPVSSDDLPSLTFLRMRMPSAIDVAAGEYGYDATYFNGMLQAGAVDVLQADVTRCGGITGFLRATALCETYMVPLSCHCAPSAHLHVACAAPRVRHMEWFHDHVHIEQMLFDGAPQLKNGTVAPDLSRPGLGLSFKHADAERYAI